MQTLENMRMNTQHSFKLNKVEFIKKHQKPLGLNITIST